MIDHRTLRPAHEDGGIALIGYPPGKKRPVHPEDEPAVLARRAHETPRPLGFDIDRRVPGLARHCGGVNNTIGESGQEGRQPVLDESDAPFL